MVGVYSFWCHLNHLNSTIQLNKDKRCLNNDGFDRFVPQANSVLLETVELANHSHPATDATKLTDHAHPIIFACNRSTFNGCTYNNTAALRLFVCAHFAEWLSFTYTQSRENGQIYHVFTFKVRMCVCIIRFCCRCLIICACL